MKKILEKVLAFALVLVLSISAFSMPAYAEEVVGWDQVTTEKVFEGENYKVTFTLASYWDSGYNANVKVENTGDSIIENWYLECDYDNTISNIWNAEIYSQELGKYVIKNAGWNADIAVGGSVEFGLSGNTNFAGFPTAFALLGNSTEASDEDYSIEYRLNSDWESGFSGEIIITNNTDATIENWILEFDFARTIVEIWNGVVESKEGNHYRINNAEYNQNILPGQSINIGFNGTDGNGEEPTNYKLFENTVQEFVGEKSVAIDKSNLIYSEEDYYFLADESSSLSGQMSSPEYVEKAYCTIKNYKLETMKTVDITAASNWTIDNIPLVVGTNNVEVVVKYVDGTECTDSIWICNFDETKMEGLEIDLDDPDQDKLVNYLEDIYGTDRNVADTDGDGISDYNELVYIGTNPTLQDTDANGVLDGRDDPDGDTISSYDEFTYGTDPSRLDSDGDMLDDYVEKFTYNTNPLAQDTDGDEADDKWEIENGTDPLVYNEKFLVSEAVDNGAMEIAVKLNVSGNQVATLKVENCESDVFINDTIPGYLGTAFDLNIDGTFDEANVTITFDEEFLSIENFNPVLYYYNESTGRLEEVATEWNGESNVVYATLEHFSRYILLNKTAFDEIWEVEFDDAGEISVGKDIVFTIDASGSMGPQGINNDPQNIRLSVAKEFVEKLGSNDKAAVISFEQYIKVLSDFTIDKDALYSAIDSVGNTGNYTYIGAAISKSIELFGNEKSDRDRYIILLTDGKSNDSIPSYQAKCQELGITIYTIGLGSNLDANLLSAIATNTGGKYYHASVASDLNDVFTEVEDEIIDDKTSDTNGDKITDYNTKLMCEGGLRTGAGALVFSGASYEMIQANDDYDGDGLLNGDEIIIVTDARGKFVNILSDPCDIDTDGDSFNDYKEVNAYKTKPLIYDMYSSELDTVTNNGIYLSSLFSEEYLESNWLKFQLFMGNALLNFRVDYTKSYKAALYDYIRVLSEVSVEELALNDLILQTGEDIEETVKTIYSWINVINAIPDDTLKLANYSETIINYTNELLELDDKLRKVSNMSEASEVITDIVSEKTKIQAQYWSLMTEYNREIAKYDKFNLSGKLAEKVGNMMYKLPTKLQSTISTVGKIAKYGDQIFVGIDTVFNVVNTVQAFSVLNAENMNYEKAFLMLDAIINNSENPELVSAASDIKSSMESQFDQFFNNAEAIIEEIERGLLQGGKVALVAELGPLVWAVELGLTLGDLVFNTGEVDELSLHTIALGDAAACISKEVRKYAVTDTSLFYLLTDNVRERLEVLGQLRIVGENAFYKAADARSFILKLITGGQGEIKEVCQDNIVYVYEKLIKHGIYVNPHYKGHVVSIY